MQRQMPKSIKAETLCNRKYSSCKDGRRKVFLRARTAEGEPGGGQVQQAAECHVSTSPLILFLTTLGKSLGYLTHTRLASPRALAACIRHCWWNKNFVPPCLQGPRLRDVQVIWFRYNKLLLFFAASWRLTSKEHLYPTSTKSSKRSYFFSKMILPQANRRLALEMKRCLKLTEK